MEITTPLGADVLLFHGMHAREELSRPSEFQINLLSERSDITVDDILGKNVTVKLEAPGDGTRYFNGYVTRFSQGGTYGRYHRYRAEVRPWLWFLSRTADCRIFQEKTVPDIVKAVFGDHTMADFALELTGSYRTWTYCVQYRETDLNFVSRLLEEEGIYYYFRHTDGHNTLVLTDSSSKHKAAEGCAKLPFIAPEKLARPDIDHISSWDFSREVQPGVYVHDDYDLERPSVEIKTRKTLERGYAPSDYEIYDYPGHYLQKPDGEQYAGIRIDEYGSQFETATAATNARGLSTGCSLKIEGCPRSDQNREYLVLSASHDLEYGEYESLPQQTPASFRCSFAAMSTKQQFRPRRRTAKPFVQGPQTAVVVGPGGDEIYTDKYGRVKVQFHWDRYGASDENSSCWVRVSQPWAGKAWGGVAIPRIGQEVIVDFLEGDPDQPIITGRVYNAEQMPPYTLPDNKTQTGIKSRSTLSGTPDNFNEIRFEDKKDEEQLFIHAERNQDIEVEKDETHWVGHDRKKTIDNDETTHVKHDRTETVDNNERITIGGNRTESVGKNETISIEKSRTESVHDDESVSIGKNQTLTVGSNRHVTVDKDESITVSGGRTDKVSKNEDVSVGKNRKVSVGDNDALQVGKNLLLDAGDQITIKTGSASITMKRDGTITIKGKDITLQGSGKINVKASSDVVVKGSKITQN
jgi:type VI secretion system secreted protein VgrG